MKSSKDLDKQIDEILAAIYLAGTENGLSRMLTDPAEIMHRKEAFIKSNPANTEAKQQLLALIEQREHEARLNEVQNAYEYWINGRKFIASYFRERIAELNPSKSTPFNKLKERV